VLRRFAGYLERRWRFRDLLGTIRDSRRNPEIPASAVFLSVFGMHALRLGSFNELEAQLRMPSRWESWVGLRKPSADTLGYALDRFDLQVPREMLAKVAGEFKRKKALRRLYPDLYWVGAVDGIETYKSRKRCCPECCIRHIEVAGELVKEYYHRYVALQLVGVSPALILDAEPLGPGETEVHAALRLLKRVKERLPRFIDVLTLDAFYLQAPFVKQALELGYGVAIVLKQEARDLYQDVEGLLKTTQPETLTTVAGTISLWDFKDLRSWESLDRPVRVVRSLEQKSLRERIGGQWVERTLTQDWRWAVVFPDAQQPAAEKIRQWGHARWDEETRGFGELTKHWHLDHCYHHHPTAMLACLLILFLAFVLTTVFFTRNLKAPLRQGRSRLHLARLLYDDLVRGGLESYWAQPP